MNVSIQLDASCGEPCVIIKTAQVTDEVRQLAQSLTERANAPVMLSAWKGDFLTMLRPEDIVRIYSGDKKVFAATEGDTYELKLRLYEIERQLGTGSFARFVRISNTDIINFDFVKNFDMSLAGTICVNFRDKTRAFVSRRYVGKIKNWLGI